MAGFNGLDGVEPGGPGALSRSRVWLAFMLELVPLTTLPLVAAAVHVHDAPISSVQFGMAGIAAYLVAGVGWLIVGRRGIAALVVGVRLGALSPFALLIFFVIPNGLLTYIAIAVGLGIYFVLPAISAIALAVVCRAPSYDWTPFIPA